MCFLFKAWSTASLDLSTTDRYKRNGAYIIRYAFVRIYNIVLFYMHICYEQVMGPIITSFSRTIVFQINTFVFNT